MTILTGKGKTIQFSQASTINEFTENKETCKVYTYVPELPTVTCTNKRDAEYIQQKVNSLVRELTRELLNEKI